MYVCLCVNKCVPVNESILCSSFPSQPNRIQLTQLGRALFQPCPHTCAHTRAHTHTHNISPLCIIWLPMLQGKAGLIEVISIRVWVDWSGNKDQGPFVHICMYVYMYVCVCVGDWVLLRLYHFSPSHSIWSLCIICFYYYKKEAHRACLVVPLWGAPRLSNTLKHAP